VKEQAMEETEFQSRLCERLGLRVGPQMAGYLLKRLSDGTLGESAIPAMGGDARTGMPVLRQLGAAELRALLAETRFTEARKGRPQTSL
jgi:hypothetical protein